MPYHLATPQQAETDGPRTILIAPPRFNARLEAKKRPAAAAAGLSRSLESEIPGADGGVDGTRGVIDALKGTVLQATGHRIVFLAINLIVRIAQKV